jgi:hypothetical protein
MSRRTIELRSTTPAHESVLAQPLLTDAHRAVVDHDLRKPIASSLLSARATLRNASSRPAVGNARTQSGKSRAAVRHNRALQNIARRCSTKRFHRPRIADASRERKPLTGSRLHAGGCPPSAMHGGSCSPGPFEVRELEGLRRIFCVIGKDAQT